VWDSVNALSYMSSDVLAGRRLYDESDVSDLLFCEAEEGSRDTTKSSLSFLQAGSGRVCAPLGFLVCRGGMLSRFSFSTGRILRGNSFLRRAHLRCKMKDKRAEISVRWDCTHEDRNALALSGKGNGQGGRLQDDRFEEAVWKPDRLGTTGLACFRLGKVRTVKERTSRLC